MIAANYDYPVSGGYADTVATLDDGRKVWINTQYGVANVKHSADCVISKQTSAYPRAGCTCGAELSDDDKAELIADARINGKTGTEPKPEPTPEMIAAADAADGDYDKHCDMMAHAMQE